VTAAGIDKIDLSDNAFWGRPLPERAAAFARLRAQERPLFFAEPETRPHERGLGYYALVRHADVAEASRNAEVFSSGTDRPAELPEYFISMINMDDPKHARLRRIVSRAFSPRMIARFEEDLRRAAAAIVDDLLAAGPGDFVPQVAARLPLKIICDMMRIPDDQYEIVMDSSSIIVPNFDSELLGEDLAQAMAKQLTAARALADLVTGLAAARAQAPGEDLVSALVTANIDGGKLTHAELAAFFILLVTAGADGTRTALSHALMLLTEFPEQRALLLSDLDNRIERAVQEIVRYASPVMFMQRTLTRDYAMNGQDYLKGDKVMLSYYSANRDEAVFADPERFDITRSPNPHVGFGAAGPHYCLGAHLARRELTVMLRELLTRVPDITAGEPDRVLSSFSNGIKRLPCHFAER
jgi:methyl-branched lipid omega-hydroxylase